MNYFDLVNYLDGKRIEGTIGFNNFRNTLQRLDETTTMDAVAFLPAHLGTVKARVKDLAKKKLDWGIEILDQEDSRDVFFEDALHVTVPNEHWDSFCSIFSNPPTNNNYLNLRGILEEALEDEMKDLRQELKVALAHLFDTPEFRKMEAVTNIWKWRFPTLSYTTREKLSVAISHEDRKNDIQELYSRLLEVYGEDRGNLEMLISTIEDKRPLNTFDVLKGYDYIFGTRIHSRYEKVDLYFESLIDMNYHLTQSIFTQNTELLDKIEEESREIKVVRNVIYPKGGVFTSRFLRVLSDTIEDLGVEEEE